MAEFDDDDEEDDVPEGPTRRARLFAWLRDAGARVGGRLGPLTQRLPTQRLGRVARVGLPIAVGLAFLANAVVRIREYEVGVVVNNLTGSISVEPNAGLFLMPPWVTTLYRLDRRVQTIQMAEAGSAGFTGGDAAKIKTSDGSNVTLDLQASYRLIPDKADRAIVNAGPDNGFGDLWVRSEVRAAVAAEFGKLTTEQIYDASVREQSANAAIASLNSKLADDGLEIVAIVVQDFRFYSEYEEIIKKKKLADQEVENQQAQARLATEDQAKQVAAANFTAQHDIDQATATAEQTRATADGYDQRVRLEGETGRINGEKQADSLLATGLADAEGMREQSAALSGGGGVNLVALEYAKQMQKIQFTGVPVVDEGKTSRMKLQSGAAAATTTGAR